MSISDTIDLKVKVRARPAPLFGPSLAKQSFKDQVNINKIIAKYNKTGMVNHLNSREPFYGDVSGISSYQESLEVVNKAHELFSGLSSEIRAKFGNDPFGMISFLEDEKNFDEAVKLGLIVPRPPEAPPAPVEVKPS